MDTTATDTKSNTITSTHILDPPFAEPMQLLCTLPKTKPSPNERNKVAIALTISPPGTAKVSLGCYIYGLYDKRRDEVYQTILNNSEEHLYDVAKRISHIVTKKFQCPTYVCCNGNIDQTSVLPVIRQLLVVLEQQWAQEQPQDE